MIRGRTYINNTKSWAKRMDSASSMQIVVNPQTGKGKHAEPENHGDNAHPKDSIWIPVNDPQRSVQHNKRNGAYKGANNKAGRQEDSEGRR